MSKSIVFVATAAVLLAACITINIYFPEAEAQRAADRIIDEVRGTTAAPGGEDTSSWYRPPAAGSIVVAVLNFVVPVAHAQGSVDFDASSPAKRALEASLKARFQKLKPYYDSGAIGLDDGSIAIRDRADIPLNERNQVRQLVSEQNADWEALYAEIARINGKPEWKEDIRRVFAERWIAKADRGWYYRDSNGEWRQK